MVTILEDRRKKECRTYILKEVLVAKAILPDGMYVGLDPSGNEAILGEPSPEIWREIKKGVGR